MAMQKAHENQNWENFPSIKTPVNEQNLNKLDRSVDEIDNRVISLDTTKFNKTEAAELFKDVSLDPKTGIITFTTYSGAKKTIDTLLEKIAINFDFDEETQEIVIELEDGTYKRIDISAFIKPNEFLDSDTVAWIVDGQTVKAIVKEGSIGEKHLRPNYLADIKVESAKAEAAKTAAETAQTEAKKSETAAATSATASATSAKESADSATAADKSATTATTQATSASNSANAAKTSETNAGNSATAAKSSETNAEKSATNASSSASTATTQANNAKTSATNAAKSAKDAESYAHGGTGTRQNEDTDNAEYYYGKSKEIYDEFAAAGDVTGVKGNAEKDYRHGNVNVTPTDIGALALTGGTVTGTTLFTQGTRITGGMTGISATAGIIKIATLTITSQYCDRPITIELSSRHRATKCVLSILFAGVNTLTPTLSSFTYIGTDYICYMHNSATSVWDLYVTKSEGYDNITVTDFKNPVGNGITVDWDGTTQVSAAPSDAQRAVLGGNVSHAATADKIGAQHLIFGNPFDGTQNVEGKGTFYGKYNAAGVQYSTAAIQIRERDLVENTQNDIKYAPGIGFHWSKRFGSNLLVSSDKKLRYLLDDGTTVGTIVANLEGTIDGKSSSDFITNQGGYIAGTLKVEQLIDNGVAPNTVPVANDERRLIGSGTTATELGFLHNVTSPIQDQINFKAEKQIYGDNAVSLGREPGSETGTFSAVVGGEANLATYPDSGVFCGKQNHSDGEWSVVLGGRNNYVGDSDSSVIGGTQNNVYSSCSSILSGKGNTVNSLYSGIIGGEGNSIEFDWSGILGGASCNVDGEKSAVIAGEKNNVRADCSVTIGGLGCTVDGENSATVGGRNLTSLANQITLGHYNDTSTSTPGGAFGTDGTAFCIGNGSGLGLSNAFRVDYAGKAWCKKAYSSTGADYAEYFEWLDGNPDNEKRTGYFVTLDGDKIRKANAGDWVLGIISANPCVIGNTDMEWQGQFLKDEFGAYIIEDAIEIVEKKKKVKDTNGEIVYEDIPVLNDDGTAVLGKNGEPVYKHEIKYEIVKEEVPIKRYKLNPDYNAEMQYTFRDDRPEWETVGMMGQLAVYDDGTCKVNGFCKVADGGIATANDTGYRVIKRLSPNIVKVILK